MHGTHLAASPHLDAPYLSIEAFQITATMTVANYIPAADDSALALIQELPVVHSRPVRVLPNGNAQIKIDRTVSADRAIARDRPKRRHANKTSWS